VFVPYETHETSMADFGLDDLECPVLQLAPRHF